uniref:Endonuclease/exonuclease/phosphatase domain-containing protein n=1 Tax=Callorhinchus milii TaxID=7868 RepID=A0A4W3I209_CALMI
TSMVAHSPSLSQSRTLASCLTLNYPFYPTSATSPGSHTAGHHPHPRLHYIEARQCKLTACRPPQLLPPMAADHPELCSPCPHPPRAPRPYHPHPRPTPLASHHTEGTVQVPGPHLQSPPWSCSPHLSDLLTPHHPVHSLRSTGSGLLHVPASLIPLSAELLRVWEELPGPPHTDQAFEFTIMSYNILSQDLLEMNGSLYTHCPPDYLTWDFRCQNILREFDTWTPDILCLQEVQEDYFQQHLQQYLRPGVETLDRDNVGLLLLLQPQDEESPQAWPPICVANTHLIYNPRRGDIKLAQLALLFAEIDRLAGLGSGAGDTRCPVILCGDMNSAPHSPLYQFIQDGQLDYYGMPVSNQEDSSHRLHQRRLYEPLWPRNLGITDHCQYRSQSDRSQPGELPRGSRRLISHGLNLTSVYSHYQSDSKQPEVTTCTSNSCLTVDYIFFSSQTQGQCWGEAEAGARLSLLSEEDLWTANGLPNGTCSSDHLCLLARFGLEPRGQ